MKPEMLFAWIRAIRPATLTASVLPVAVAHFWSMQQASAIEIRWTVLALLSAVLIQIGTNLFNDVIDAQEGADSELRIGPRRLIQQGIATPHQVKAVAHACFLAALLIGVPLVVRGGVPILVIGALSIVFGYGYSAPPFKLAYRGLAEPFIILFFGIFAVGGVVWLHLFRVSGEPLLLGAVMGLLATNLLVVNNIRDYETDRAAGKRTLVARFGIHTGVYELKLLVLVAVLAVGFWSVQYLTPALTTLIALLPAVSATAIVDIPRKQHLAMMLVALSHLSFGVLASCIVVQYG